MTYLFSKSISLGLEYQHYHNIGKLVGLIDYEALAIGNLSEALKVIPTEVNIDIFSANLIFRF